MKIRELRKAHPEFVWWAEQVGFGDWVYLGHCKETDERFQVYARASMVAMFDDERFATVWYVEGTGMEFPETYAFWAAKRYGAIVKEAADGSV